MQASEATTTLVLSGGEQLLRVRGDAGEVACALWPGESQSPRSTAAVKLEISDGGIVYVNPNLVVYLRAVVPRA